MRPVVLLAAAAAAASLGGCGAAAPDLFVIEREGRDRNADITLRVTDGGTVTCNRSQPRALDSKRLLVARSLARDLEPQAALDLVLPAGEDASLRYRITTEAGTVAFGDRSAGRPKTFDRAVAFTSDVAENVCRIER